MSLAMLDLFQAEPVAESALAARPARDWLAEGLGWAQAYGWQLLGAVLTLLVGLWIAKLIVSGVRGMLIKGKVDATLSQFLANLTFYALATLVAITALGSPSGAEAKVCGDAAGTSTRRSMRSSSGPLMRPW